MLIAQKFCIHDQDGTEDAIRKPSYEQTKPVRLTYKTAMRILSGSRVNIPRRYEASLDKASISRTCQLISLSFEPRPSSPNLREVIDHRKSPNRGRTYYETYLTYRDVTRAIEKAHEDSSNAYARQSHPRNPGFATTSTCSPLQVVRKRRETWKSISRYQLEPKALY